MLPDGATSNNKAMPRLHLGPETQRFWWTCGRTLYEETLSNRSAGTQYVSSTPTSSTAAARKGPLAILIRKQGTREDIGASSLKGYPNARAH